MLICEDGETKG